MSATWMTTIARQNDTSTAITSEDNSSWRPLAIALPVCLVGIPLVTVLIIVLVTCYRSKFKHKEISVFGRKLNGESRNRYEVAEIENEAGENRTENPASLTSVYANLSETVEEARRKEAMGNNTSNHNGIAKSLPWPLKMPWKKSQLGEGSVNTTENTETEKNPTTDVTDHKELRKDEAEKEKKETRRMDEAKSSGTGMDKTPGKTAAETVGFGSLLKPKANGQAVGGLHGVPLRQKNEMTTKNQNTENVITTTTKPSQTDNRKTFVVMYPMDSDEVNHLSLAVNDVIFYMDEEKDGWMKGEKKESGEIGWFPRTNVREGMSPLVKRHSLHLKTEASSETNNKARTTTDTMATMATMATSPQCDNDNDAFEDFDDDDDDDDDDYETGIEYQALYPYRATEDGDINFDAGDVIVVVEKQDNGWWRGYHGDDHGFFPGSYVQILHTEESSQSLTDLSQTTTGDFGRATGDCGQLEEPEMLLTLAEEEEVDYDDEALQQKQNKKKMKSARKSIGVFLMSLPRRIATSNRAGNETGHGGSPVVTSDADPIKTKKSDRVVIPGVKKNKNKNKKTKNNLRPMTRRSSLAPAPPQSGPQGEAVGDLVKSVMSGLAHLVATEAQLRHDPLNTTYEEIGTPDLFSPTGSEFNPTGSEFNLSESRKNLLHQDDRTPNSSDVMTDGNSSTSPAAASLVFGAKRNDIFSSSQVTTDVTTYSNLDFSVQSVAAAAKDSSNRRGQETKSTEDNKHQREIKNKEQMMNTGRGPSSTKPVPPQKPSYIGSTPNIAELLSAIDRRTDRGVRRSPGNKPKTPAKPGRRNSGGGRGSDLGLTEADLRKVLPPSQKPKPLKEKPRYLSPGFPQGVAPKSDHQMRRRDIYRSLDSILVAAEAEDGTSDEDEAAGEPEIINWLRKKLSAEDELIGREAEAGVRAEGGSHLTGGGKELQKMQRERTKDISDGTTQNVEPKDGPRIILMFESLSKAGLNEESFA